MKFVFSLDVILCGWLGSRQLTNCTILVQSLLLRAHFVLSLSQSTVLVYFLLLLVRFVHPLLHRRAVLAYSLLQCIYIFVHRLLIRTIFGGLPFAVGTLCVSHFSIVQFECTRWCFVGIWLYSYCCCSGTFRCIRCVHIWCACFRYVLMWCTRLC